jgi:hypothetical protein
VCGFDGNAAYKRGGLHAGLVSLQQAKDQRLVETRAAAIVQGGRGGLGPLNPLSGLTTLSDSYPLPLNSHATSHRLVEGAYRRPPRLSGSSRPCSAGVIAQ